MFIKELKYAYLLDFYGSLLDEHNEHVMKLYYDDDLSLQEIAEGEGISRQGVRHIIKRSEELLDFYEARLGLQGRAEELKALSSRLRQISEELSHGDVRDREALALDIDAVAQKLEEYK